MSFALPRQPLYTKPSGRLALNLDHWSAQYLRVCVPMGPTPLVQDLVRRGTSNLAGNLNVSPLLHCDPRAGFGFYRSAGNYTGSSAAGSDVVDARAYATPTATVTAVIRPMSNPGLGTFFARTTSSIANGMWALGYDGGTNWRFSAGDSGGQKNAVSAVGATDNRLAFLVGTIGPVTGSANLFLYVNSPVVSGSTTTTALASITQNYTIGSRLDSNQASSGVIFDVAVYDVEWKPGQIAAWLEDPWAKYYVLGRTAIFDIGAVTAAARARALLVSQAAKRASYF